MEKTEWHYRSNKKHQYSTTPRRWGKCGNMESLCFYGEKVRPNPLCFGSWGEAPGGKGGVRGRDRPLNFLAPLSHTISLCPPPQAPLRSCWTSLHLIALENYGTSSAALTSSLPAEGPGVPLTLSRRSGSTSRRRNKNPRSKRHDANRQLFTGHLCAEGPAADTGT